MRLFTCSLFILFLFSNIDAQYVDIKNIDEGVFYAQTKQVNQFFRRFNNQEDIYGKRVNLDSIERNNNRRKEYLKALFDDESNISNDMRSWFIKDVTNKNDPVYLDFHKDGFVAEVSARFTYKGRKEEMLLFLKLEHENLGYKWVLVDVYFYPFDKLFFADGDTAHKNEFLHPLSHEIDFMNLHKVFRNKSTVEYYTDSTYSPDYLTLFLYELKNNNLSFETITHVKFHFFQVRDWYFELSYMNRPGNNSGWLITNLLRINDTEKEELIKMIYHE